MNSYGGYTRLVCNMVKLSKVLVKSSKVIQHRGLEQYIGIKSDQSNRPINNSRQLVFQTFKFVLGFLNNLDLSMND